MGQTLDKLVVCCLAMPSQAVGTNQRSLALENRFTACLHLPCLPAKYGAKKPVCVLSALTCLSLGMTCITLV